MEDSSFTFTLSGESSVLETYHFPPIELSRNKNYVIGLIELLTFNSIPNIDSNCNKLYIGEEVITLPTGSYEINDINEYVQTRLSKDVSFSLTANNNTLKSVITSNQKVNFNPKDAIADYWGFPRLNLRPIRHTLRHIL